jgi:hypothetical protein
MAPKKESRAFFYSIYKISPQGKVRVVLRGAGEIATLKSAGLTGTEYVQVGVIMLFMSVTNTRREFALVPL